MSNTAELISVQLDPDRLTDPNAFEAARQAAYGEPDELKADAFDSLLEEAQVKGGEGETALDFVLSGAAEQQSNPHVRRDRRDPESRLRPDYTITIDPDKMVVAGILRRNPIPLDMPATARQQHMANRVGYGPKTNGSSFRTSRI